MYLRAVAKDLAEKTDEELMLLYQTGDEMAFQVLYERHFEKVYGFILSRVRNKEKTLDICQEIFVRVHRHKDLYKGNLPLIPWLFTIAKNTMLNRLGQISRDNERIILNDELVAKAGSPAQIEENNFLEVLSELPDTQRSAIQMRYFDEKSFDEIASVLNTSSINVRQMISRGLKKIKNLMGNGLKA